MTEPTRCRWAQGDALMAAYHDSEWAFRSAIRACCGRC